ncbi:MAG: hypothetical protein JXB46_11170, partial [Candidatus Eisenbacteria bacterium]|nr:hypothetical protein [Candidatus Eisenbacteria bacterium]
LSAGTRPGAYASALAALLNMRLAATPSGCAVDRRSPSLLRRRLERLREPWRCKMMVRHRALLSLAVVSLLVTSAMSMASFAGNAGTDSKAPPPPTKPAPPDAPAPQPAPSEFFISKMVPPEYPEVAKQQNLEAIVFLEITTDADLAVTSAVPKTIIVGHSPLEVIKVGKDGKVAEPVEEEGMAAYHEIFIEAAVEAALQWRLEARPPDALPEERVMVVPIQFRLDGDSKAPEEEEPK